MNKKTKNSLIILGSLTAIYLLCQTKNKFQTGLPCCIDASPNEVKLNGHSPRLAEQEKLPTNLSLEKTSFPLLKDRRDLSTDNQQSFETNVDPDVIKWGTKEGIIDVADEQATAKKEGKRLENIKKVSQQATQSYIAAKKVEFEAKGIAIENQTQLVKAFLADEQSTQFSISNLSDQPRAITLWNANQGLSISPALPSDVADHRIENSTINPAGIHPQGIVYNPVNGLVYVAGQLSDNINVFDQQGNALREIKLTDNLMPGSVSPTGLAVNTDRTSSMYGFIYVCGSVSNQVYEIDLDDSIQRIFTVGIRPLKVLFNTVTGDLLISNLVSDTVSAIELVSGSIREFPVGSQPYSLAVNKQGDAAVTNSGENSVSIISVMGQVSQINQLIDHPTEITYHPTENLFYMISSSSDELTLLNAETLVKERAFNLRKQVSSLNYNPINELVYVSMPDNSIAAFSNQGLVDTVRFDSPVGQIAFNTERQLFFTASSQSVNFQVIGYKKQSSQIMVDEQLGERIKEFQNKPVIVTASRMVISDPKDFHTIRLVKRSMTGGRQSRTVAVANSVSAQHRSNIIDLTGMENTRIDGQQAWEFDLPANQSITFLISYRQFDPYYLLPKTG